MTVRDLAKWLLPPVLVDAARLVRRRWTGPAETPVAVSAPSASRPEWEYIPEGWQYRPPELLGWDVDSVAKTQKEKWPRFRELVQGNGPLGVYHEARTLSNRSYVAHNTFMSYGYVLALAARHQDRISILDWGSGLGHYYLISQALLPGVELDYHAKDLPLLCQAGREVLPQVTFHESSDCLSRRYSLVLASGSLHYHRDWPTVLAQLAGASDPFLYVTRLPIVHRTPSFVVVQRPYVHGYQTEYLGWFFNRDEFLARAEAAGLRLLREFLIDERPVTSEAPEQCDFRGFLFQADARTDAGARDGR